MSRERAIVYLSIFLISFMTLLIYSNTLHSPFLFDDIDNIVGNAYLTDLKYIPQFFTGGITHPLRAVAFTTFALNYRLGGLEVPGYHMFNIFLHMFNGILVFYFVWKVRELNLRKEGRHFREVPGNGWETRVVPLFTALLFVAHPVQTMGVTYIVQRNGQLATFFYLSLFLSFIQGALSVGRRKTIYYSLTIIFFLCAMWSKEIAVTAPLLLLIFYSIFIRKKGERIFVSFRGLLPFLFLLIIVISYALYTINILAYWDRWLHPDPENEGMALWSMGQNLLTQFNVIVQYIGLLFYPALDRLNADRAFPLAESLFEIHTAFSFLLILSMIWSAFLLSRRQRVISFGICWFLVALLPDSSIIPLEDIMVEYRLYLPSIGFWMAGVAAIEWAIGKVTHQRAGRWAMASVFFAFLALTFSITAYQRNLIYQSRVAFWEDAVSKSPDKPRPLFNLGRVYYEAGAVKKAVGVLRRGIQAYPEIPVFDYNLGVIYQKEGFLLDAVHQYGEVLKDKPEDVNAHINLASIYRVWGRLDQAVFHHQRALAGAPQRADLHYSLANTYEEKGRFEDAVSGYKEALRLDPAYPGAMARLKVLGD